MKMACKVYNLSKKEMKSFLFIEAFLKVLRKLPTIICDNVEHDLNGIISNLKKNKWWFYFYRYWYNKGSIEDKFKLGVLKYLKVKKKTYDSCWNDY